MCAVMNRRGCQSWGGGIAVRNLPHFTAILPQFFFSVMPLFKNFIFPLPKNSFTPLADTRHTVRCMCSHMSCVSFVWQDTSLLLCSQNVIHFWGQ